MSFDSTEFPDSLLSPELFFNFFLGAIMGLILPGVPLISNTESSLYGSTSSGSSFLALVRFFSGVYDGDGVSYSVLVILFSFKGVRMVVSPRSTLNISFRKVKSFVSFSFTAVNAGIIGTS